jgi:hypothetical protein
MNDRRSGPDRRRTHSDNAMLEDLQAVLLDLLIEQGLHQKYQAQYLAGLPADLRKEVRQILQEDEETSRYMEDRIRAAIAILAEARPGPNAYNPDRPAVRVPRPLSYAKEMV